MPSDQSREAALLVEDQAHSAFLKEARLYGTRDPDIVFPEHELPLIDWWAVMQHYGAPTRLLDWTLSPFVAAYFAVEREAEQPGAVYLLQPYKLHEANSLSNEYKALQASETVWDGAATKASFVMAYAQSRYSATRMIAQQGHYTVCTDVLGDHGDVIAKTMPPQGDSKSPPFYRLVIPAELKPEFRQHLRTMNVTASSLFPGVDGLGRSIAERIRLHIENP